MNVKDTTTNKLDSIPCGSCNGFYKIRESKFGTFAGCSNYPNCKSTLSLSNFVLEYLKMHGLNIYCWDKKCYKCGKITKVYSYYLNYDLTTYSDFFEQICPIGLGDLNYVDKQLSELIPTIQMRYSSTTHSKYMANICQHCGSLQGRNYVVEDPDEIFEYLSEQGGMDEFLYKIIRFLDISAITTDIKNIFDGL